MTLKELKKLEEIADKATKDKGPWHNCFRMFGDTGEWSILSGITYHGSVVESKDYNMISMNDCDYIAALNPEIAKSLIKLARMGLIKDGLVENLKQLSDRHGYILGIESKIYSFPNEAEREHKNTLNLLNVILTKLGKKLK